MNVGKCVTMGGYQVTEVLEVSERIESTSVTVTPHQTQRVVAHGFDFFELRVAAGLEFDGSTVALAPRARAVTAQETIGNAARRTVRPFYFKPGGSMGSFDSNGARQKSHCS